MKKLIPSLIFLFMLYPVAAFTQTSDWTSFTDGHKVVDIVKDSNILWIATTGGIVKIDIANGDTIFLTKSNTGLGSYSITAIEVDLQHNLWVGTDKQGLFIYDGINWINNSFSIDFRYKIIRDIKRDNSGNIWIGCEFWFQQQTAYPGGLYMFNGSTWTDFTNSIVNTEKSVYQIECDRLGKVLIGEGVLTIYDGTSWLHNTVNPVYRFAVDSLNHVWILNGTSTLQMFDGINWNSIPVTIVLPQNFPSSQSIICDSANNIWIGSWLDNNIGLLKYDGSTWSNYSTSNSGLVSNRITSLYSSANKIFIGTNTDGLNTFSSNQTWEVMNTSNSMLNGNWVQTVFVDTSTNVVYTSTNSPDPNISILISYDGQQWNFIDTLPTPAEAIYKDSQNRLWAGAIWGLKFFDGTSWTLFDTSNTNFPDPQVTTITEDANGHIWVGGGSVYNCFLAEYDGTSWTVYPTPTFPGTYDVNRMVIDNAGNKWLASYSGLFALDMQHQWHSYTNFNGQSTTDNEVRDLAYDPSTDALFLATSDGVIKKWGVNFTHIDSIYTESIEVDRYGHVWTCPFYRDSLFVYDQAGQLLTNFTSENSGLPFQPFIRDFSISNNGEVWMATGNNGLVLYTKGSTIDVNEINFSNRVDCIVYPNPFASEIFLTMHSQNFKEASFSLKNTLGQMVYEEHKITPGKTSESVDLNFLSRGIYLLEVTIDSNRIVKKIVKE